MTLDSGLLFWATVYIRQTGPVNYSDVTTSSGALKQIYKYTALFARHEPVSHIHHSSFSFSVLLLVAPFALIRPNLSLLTK